MQPRFHYNQQGSRDSLKGAHMVFGCIAQDHKNNSMNQFVKKKKNNSHLCFKWEKPFKNKLHLNNVSHIALILFVSPCFEIQLKHRCSLDSVPHTFIYIYIIISISREPQRGNASNKLLLNNSIKY